MSKEEKLHLSIIPHADVYGGGGGFLFLRCSNLLFLHSLLLRLPSS